MPEAGPPIMNSDSAAIATLNIRVSGLENQLQQLAASLGAQLSSLSSKLEERSKTQWPVIVGFASILIAGMAYMDQAKLLPLKERDAEIVSIIKDVQGELKATVVPQWVHAREWKYRDDQFLAHTARVELIERNTSERIKRLEDMFGNTWSIRDAITTFQQRIDRLEQGLPKN